MVGFRHQIYDGNYRQDSDNTWGKTHVRVYSTPRKNGKLAFVCQAIILKFDRKTHLKSRKNKVHHSYIDSIRFYPAKTKGNVKYVFLLRLLQKPFYIAPSGCYESTLRYLASSTFSQPFLWCNTYLKVMKVEEEPLKRHKITLQNMACFTFISIWYTFSFLPDIGGIYNWVL